MRGRWRATGNCVVRGRNLGHTTSRAVCPPRCGGIGRCGPPPCHACATHTSSASVRRLRAVRRDAGARARRCWSLVLLHLVPVPIQLAVVKVHVTPVTHRGLVLVLLRGREQRLCQRRGPVRRRPHANVLVRAHAVRSVRCVSGWVHNVRRTTTAAVVAGTLAVTWARPAANTCGPRLQPGVRGRPGRLSGAIRAIRVVGHRYFG